MPHLMPRAMLGSGLGAERKTSASFLLFSLSLPFIFLPFSCCYYYTFPLLAAFSPHSTNSQARSLDVIEVRRITPAPRASSVIPESRHQAHHQLYPPGRELCIPEQIPDMRSPLFRLIGFIVLMRLPAGPDYLAFHPVACLV
jgi:hypothetical protein